MRILLHAFEFRQVLDEPISAWMFVSLALAVYPIVTANEGDKMIMHVTKNAEIALQMMQPTGLLQFVS